MGEIPEIKEEESEQIAQDESLPLVHLIHTGGTIASKVDYSTGAVTAKIRAPASYFKQFPSLGQWLGLGGQAWQYVVR